MASKYLTFTDLRYFRHLLLGYFNLVPFFWQFILTKIMPSVRFFVSFFAGKNAFLTVIFYHLVGWALLE